MAPILTLIRNYKILFKINVFFKINFTYNKCTKNVSFDVATLKFTF
jgi:hypothetical protein